MAANTNIIYSFSDFIHEEVGFCDMDEYLGGLQESEIYYCPISKIQTLRIPSVTGSFDFAGTISYAITCVQGFGFKKVKALIDTASLASKISGPIGKKKDSTELEGVILGTRAKLIGMSLKVRHRPFIFIVKDRNEKMFVVGNLVSPAYLSTFDLSSGKKTEDENGASFKIESNAIIYEYNKEIPVIAPDDLSGDFSSDFDNDFD